LETDVGDKLFWLPGLWVLAIGQITGLSFMHTKNSSFRKHLHPLSYISSLMILTDVFLCQSQVPTQICWIMTRTSFAVALVELLVSADISIVHIVSLQAGEMMLSEHQKPERAS